MKPKILEKHQPEGDEKAMVPAAHSFYYYYKKIKAHRHLNPRNPSQAAWFRPWFNLVPLGSTWSQNLLNYQF